MDRYEMSKPKVSIITTVLNAVETIEETILSVLGQTYDNIEYIIIDGASTDGTIQIIEKYIDHISFFKSEADHGIADGFNKGLSKVTGEWIGIINGDDSYTMTAVETMMNNASNETAVICGNILLTGKNGFSRIKKSKVNWLDFGMFIMHPTCLIHKQVYKKTGFYDSKYKIAMDFDFFLRLRKKGFKIKHVDETVVFMRTGGESNNISRMHLEEIIVIKQHLTGVKRLAACLYKRLDIIRWKYFYRSPFGIIPDYAENIPFKLN